MFPCLCQSTTHVPYQVLLINNHRKVNEPSFRKASRKKVLLGTQSSPRWTSSFPSSTAACCSLSSEAHSVGLSDTKHQRLIADLDGICPHFHKPLRGWISSLLHTEEFTRRESMNLHPLKLYVRMCNATRKSFFCTGCLQ